MRDKSFFYIPSFSSRTIIYKGLLLANQIGEFYNELLDPDTKSALCLVHQRFSTNTFPTWQLAHPFRYMCHNGEINTVRGNVNWMNARAVGAAVAAVSTISRRSSRSFSPASAIRRRSITRSSVDHGRPFLPHVMAMLIPEAWDADTTMPRGEEGRFTNITLR